MVHDKQLFFQDIFSPAATLAFDCIHMVAEYRIAQIIHCSQDIQYSLASIYHADKRHELFPLYRPEYPLFLPLFLSKR